MENSERFLSGSGEVELDPDIVSEEAGKLYSELQTVIETHGEGVVESLVPIFVWVLEGLATCKAQLRDREEEAEREKAEREELLERYQTEKALRKESQERYLELDDQIEQERRAARRREKERERRERDVEKKAREQADQLVALEEEKAHLSKELSTLRNSHNKLTNAYRDLSERRKDNERESPLRNHMRSKNADSPTPQMLPEDAPTKKKIHRRYSNSNPPCEEDLVVEEAKMTEATVKKAADPLVTSIIGSTPELTQFHDLVKASTPVHFSIEDTPPDDSETGLEMLMTEKDVPEDKEETLREELEKDQEKEEELDDDDSAELGLRNTDSVFSELSELSRDYVDSVDHGASVRDGGDQFEFVLAQFEELKINHELVESARKALLSRVVELTDDRTDLMMEVVTLQETVSRLEGRTKEKEEELKRLRKELEVYQSEDPDASLSVRHFSRSEMARVVMEKNQYKQRLFELQEATRQSQTLRAAKERFSEDRRTSVWKKFNRLFGLSKQPLVPPAHLGSVRPGAASVKHSPVGFPQQPAVNRTQAEPASPAVVSPRVRRRELYREIRSYIWGNLGRRQIHGWSTPLANTQESQEPAPEPKDVPVLIQLRLLDQKDCTAKVNCAVAVPSEISGEASCSVWVVSGPASCSDITVIDPARSNTVVDQFSLPPTAPALCICAVPPIGNSQGSVWIGTQEGSILIHSASGERRCCLQTMCFSEGIYSLSYFSSQVVAGLADGTLAFFPHTTEGWNFQSHSVMSLGVNPLQPIRCCLAKAGRLWVGYWNKVHVVDSDTKKVEQVFSVSERSEQQVRFLCAAGSGVWISCRLDPILRLFDWSTGRPLQEVDFSSLVSKALGQPFLTLSPLQISSLNAISGRLWVGTGGGAIFSMPLSITSEDVSIPYCSTASAQLSYHGHRQSVRFIIGAPGCLIAPPGSTQITNAQLILSGGEGYINFRIGDDGSDEQTESIQTSPQRSERSHMIIWQSSSPSMPSPAL